MKYIKEQVHWFSEVVDRLDNRLNSYKEYGNKYIVYMISKDVLSVGLIKNFDGYNVLIEDYDWDDFYKGYVCNTLTKHISEFEILDSFDTLKEAFDRCHLIKDVKKYNL